MRNPAALAAVPGLIRATRLSIEENAPATGLVGVQRAVLIGLLLYAEISAEMLAEMVPAAGEPARREPIPVTPLVPRHDESGRLLDPATQLPFGRPHP